MTVRKYMPLQLYTFENLVNQQLMFVDPCMFNDVYDCFLLHDDDFIKTLRFKESSELNRIRVLCVRKIEENSKKDRTEIESYFWAFYGDAHRGVCVEFDLPYNPKSYAEENIRFYSEIDSVKLDINNQVIKGKTSVEGNSFYDLELGLGQLDIDKQIFIRKSNYQDNILDNISTLKHGGMGCSNFKDFLERTVFLKDKLFEKENEFRLVKFVENETKLFEPFSIKEMERKKIIFGYKCNKNYERLIYNTLITEDFKFSTMTETMRMEEYHAQ